MVSRRRQLDLEMRKLLADGRTTRDDRVQDLVNTIQALDTSIAQDIQWYFRKRLEQEEKALADTGDDLDRASKALTETQTQLANFPMIQRKLDQFDRKLGAQKAQLDRLARAATRPPDPAGSQAGARRAPAGARCGCRSARPRG